jgi:hypothetical protein
MAFLAGVLLTLPSAMYLAALKDIAEAEVSTQEEVFAIVLFNVLMLLPALIPLSSSSSCRTRRRRLSSEPIAGCAIIRSGWSRVAGGVGIYLTGKGLVALSGERLRGARRPEGREVGAAEVGLEHEPARPALVHERLALAIVEARDEQHGELGTRLRQRARDVEAAGLAQADVEQDRVRGKALGGRDG